MIHFLKRSWATVDLSKLTHNVTELRRRLSPGAKIMGVVKADAYGHGDQYVAEQLTRIGVDWLGVSNLDEALSLRTQNITLPMLIFGITPPEYAKTLAEHSITTTVHSLDYARELNAAAEAAAVRVSVHIKLDTGMSRLGFVVTAREQEASLDEVAAVCALPHLEAGGIFTHFAVADEENEDATAFTRSQFAYFRQSLDKLEQRGFRFALRHCCNSAASIRFPEMHLDMVRPGVLLYGMPPSRDCKGLIPLKPVMDLYSCITMVKEIDEGAFVSYGRTYTAHRRMMVATVPIGYADGFERELSNKARMLVRGRIAHVIGRICMDQLMLDVTHIEGVQAGDIVTIVGTDGNHTLTFDEMADRSGTINYEKTCLIGKRVPRIYLRDGQEVGVVDYIRRSAPTNHEGENQ